MLFCKVYAIVKDIVLQVTEHGTKYAVCTKRRDDLSFPTRNQTWAPLAVKPRSPNYWTAREFPLDFSNNFPTHQIPDTIQGRTCDVSLPPAEAGTGDEESQAPGHSSTHMSLLEATVSPFARSRASEMPEQSPPRSGMPGCPREAQSVPQHSHPQP